MTKPTTAQVLTLKKIGVIECSYIQFMLAQCSEPYEGEYGMYTARIVIHDDLVCIFMGHYLGEADPELIEDMYQSANKDNLKFKH